MSLAGWISSSSPSAVVSRSRGNARLLIQFHTIKARPQIAAYIGEAKRQERLKLATGNIRQSIAVAQAHHILTVCPLVDELE